MAFNCSKPLNDLPLHKMDFDKMDFELDSKLVS